VTLKQLVSNGKLNKENLTLPSELLPAFERLVCVMLPQFSVHLARLTGVMVAQRNNLTTLKAKVLASSMTIGFTLGQLVVDVVVKRKYEADEPE